MSCFLYVFWVFCEFGWVGFSVRIYFVLYRRVCLSVGFGVVVCSSVYVLLGLVPVICMYVTCRIV